MAGNPNSLSSRIRTSLTSLYNSPILSTVSDRLRIPLRYRTQSRIRCISHTVSASRFTWEDVFKISQSETDSSDLQGFFEKIRTCNRGSEKHSEFLPFVIEDQIVGYIHNGFADHLRRFQDVFNFPPNSSYGSRFGSHVTLHPMLRTSEDKTEAVGDVVKCLGEELIPGIRNELYPVTSSFGTSAIFSLERAAAPYFGIKAYGVHMNGYVERVWAEISVDWEEKSSETHVPRHA
ncbi:hypothetical protein F0562_009509 [Nyssa sinensis]|uniref:DUF4743 domain-containing protein n=1 Tax=Nyssa sinensis TaxID=561372 RepID=A0A5J4ZZ85_9ASTE|nr:hypothetical protein F0562_009509 [Nyssa sinensis]